MRKVEMIRYAFHDLKAKILYSLRWIENRNKWIIKKASQYLFCMMIYHLKGKMIFLIIK